MREEGGPAGLPFLLRKSRLRLGEVLEVGVLEEGWVFEAVTKDAVERDVGGPDEC